MSTPAHLWLEDENGSPELHYECHLMEVHGGEYHLP